MLFKLHLKYFKYCKLKHPFYAYTMSKYDLTYFPKNSINLIYCNNTYPLIAAFKHSRKKFTVDDIHSEYIYKWIILGFEDKSIPQLINCNFKQFKQYYASLIYPQLTNINIYDYITGKDIMNEISEQPTKIPIEYIITKI